MLRSKSAFWALKRGGASGLLIHLFSRILGDAHYLRPASSVDFKVNKMESFQSLRDLIHSLILGSNLREIDKFLHEADEFLQQNEKSKEKNLSFPGRWNSGRNLQLLLFSFIRLTRPEIVLETGTANGASALAISGALERNNYGTLYSFDIEDSDAVLVPSNLKQRINFVKTDGTEAFLYNFMKPLMLNVKDSLFLHDADHSYIGQMTDYENAVKLNFSYLFSDDIDTSLAFCDFAGFEGKVFFDAPKFIGCMRNNKRLIRK